MRSRVVARTLPWWSHRIALMVNQSLIPGCGLHIPATCYGDNALRLRFHPDRFDTCAICR
nr:MAG TPA: hypothetical protein [Bacteriophage sp.]